MSDNNAPSTTTNVPLIERLGVSWPLAVTLGVGVIGMFIAAWVNMPGGPLIGAMALTAIVRLLKAPMAEPPNWIKIGARILLGLTIGARVTPDTLSAIARAFVPMLLMILAIVALGILIARTIHRVTHMPLPTALCGSSPGGLAAMVSLADALSGEGAVVASMHLIRLMSVTIFVPAIVRGWFEPIGAANAAVAATSAAAAAPTDLGWRVAALAVIALGLGALAEWRKVPSGSLIAGMLVAAVLNPLWLHLPEMPAAWTFISQLIVGAGVGATMTRQTLRNFRPYALSGVLMTATLIACGLGLGFVLHALTSLDLVTAIMGCSPGGAETMMLLSVELGADPQIVAAMHVTRLIVLTAVLPFAIKFAAVGRRADPSPTQSMAE